MPLSQQQSQLEQNGAQKRIVVEYAVHMHPLTQIETPDLLEKDKYSTFDITCQILYTALPLFLCFVLNSGTSLLNIFWIASHEADTVRFVSVCFGTILANVFVYYIIENIGLGFNFVCSYFEHKEDIGYMYQKALGINFFVCILITPVLYLSDKLFLWAGLEENLVLMASDYVWALVPSFYLYAFFQTTNNYLQSQRVLYPPIVISVFGNLFHLVVSYLFIYELQLGMIGVAWAKNLSDGLMSLALYVYIVWWEPTKESWIEWDIKATNNIHRFLVEAVSEQLYVFLEVGAFQLMCIIACGLSDFEELSAHFIFAFTYLISYFGFSAISHCVNKELSVSIEDDGEVEGRYKGIRTAQKKVSLGVLISLILSLVLVFNIQIHQREFFWIFQQNEGVEQHVKGNFYIFYGAVVLTGLQVVLLGVVKTLQVRVLWKISLGSFYVIGLGSTVVLGYLLELGLRGLWLGWALGYLVSLALLVKYIHQMDWEETFRLVRDKFKAIEEDIRVSKMELIDDNKSERSIRAL